MTDLGATAGVAGQAEGIAASLGLSAELAVSAAAIFAVANMVGGLVAGWAADRLRANRLITALPLGATVAAALITLAGGATLVLAAIAGLGFCYGALIAVYPAAIGSIFGVLAGPLHLWSGVYRVGITGAGV